MNLELEMREHQGFETALQMRSVLTGRRTRILLNRSSVNLLLLLHCDEVIVGNKMRRQMGFVVFRV